MVLSLERVVEVGESHVGPRGGFVELCGVVHAKGLVRALVIEVVDELIEAGLLGSCERLDELLPSSGSGACARGGRSAAGCRV